MTEAEWLACDDPHRMLRFVRFGNGGLVAGRVAQLFGRKGIATPQRVVEFCRACFRWAGMRDSNVPIDPGASIRLAVEARVEQEIERISSNAWEDEMRWDDLHRATSAGNYARAEAEKDRDKSRAYWLADLAPVVRDVFPYRPVTVKSHWLTEIVTSLTTGINKDGAFDRLPILADALEEAGCDNTDVLNHCRGNGPHVRGCWVVDLVLGKAYEHLMAPPWIKYPSIPPMSLGWRMGEGERYWLEFWAWWEAQPIAVREATRAAYPEPPEWVDFYERG